MKKVIYANFTSDYWVDVAARLVEGGELQPVYWIARPEQETIVKAQFPDVIFHSVFDAVKGIPCADFNPVRFSPIDEQVLGRLSICQLTALKMMDRIDALGSFGYHDRTRLFLRVLDYWQTVADQLEPDLVIFSTIPHMIYDYVLYEICKLRGIRTLMFESTSMMGLTFLMEEYNQPSKLEKHYRALLKEDPNIEITLSSEVETYLETLKGTYDQVPAYARRAYKEKLPKVHRSTSNKGFLQKLFDFSNYPDYIAKQKRILDSRFGSPQNYMKPSGRKLEETPLSRLEYEIIRRKSARKMKSLERQYHRLAREVDLNQDYIYVALNFQPERTSSPMASVFVNQLLMVDLLAKSIPLGWRVVVKEHPTQFTASKHFRSQSGRTKDFYDDLAALPNVTLAPMTVDSFDLIDHARAVATLTGTVGWESVHRGKPVLIFGYPWYRGCEGTFQVSTTHDCVTALQKIDRGYTIDARKLRLFVYAVEKTGLKASVEAHLKTTDLSDDENAELLARALLEY